MSKISSVLLVLLFFSCTSNVNLIEIDILTEISIFPEYEDNLKFAQDMSALNWNQIFKDEINGFKEEETNNLIFFINTQEANKVIKIQLRTEKGAEPKHYDEIRKITLQKIRRFENIYLQNEEFILGASKLADQHIKLLDYKRYDRFFKLMDKEIQKGITEEIKEKTIQGREALNIDSSDRKFLCRVLNTTDSLSNENINIIHIFYSFDNKGSNETLTYQLLENSIVLSGYHYDIK